MSIQNIISEMRNQGNLIIDEIKKDYSLKIEELKNNLEQEYINEYTKQSQLVKKQNNEYMQGQILSYQLEAKKSILASKQAFIEKVLQHIIDNFQNLVDSKNYYNFIKHMLIENTSEGDIIYLSSKDINLSDQLTKDMDKKVTFKEGLLKAGVIIEKENYKHNLSVESLLKSNYTLIQQTIGSYF